MTFLGAFLVRTAIPNQAVAPLALGAVLILLLGMVVPILAQKTIERGVDALLGVLARTFTWAGRSRIARQVERRTGQFLNAHLLRSVAGIDTVNLQVSWVKESGDARLKDGKVIIRMRHENDPERNMIMALWFTMKRILWPHARSYMPMSVVVALDLMMVRLFTEHLGKEARRHYHTDLLEPSAAQLPELLQQLPILEDIDEGGLFQSILLQELVYLDDQFADKAPRGNVASELREFLGWLRKRALREPGDESIPLRFTSDHIKVGIVLTSKEITAAQGTLPYVQAAGLHLAGGCTSIYLMGVTNANTYLCDEIHEKLSRDPRLQAVLSSHVHRKSRGGDSLPLHHYRRDTLALPHGTLAARLGELGLKPGAAVDAKAIEVQSERALFQVAGFDATMNRADAAWGYDGSIELFFSPGIDYRCEIKEVRQVIRLSRKALLPSPWEEKAIPPVGFDMACEVVRIEEDRICVRLLSPDHPELEFFGMIQPHEWSWLAPEMEDYLAPELHMRTTARISELDHASDVIVLSRQAIETKDFRVARRKYRDGVRATATVLSVDYDGLYCELEPGVFGRVGRPNLLEGGYELQKFEQSVMPGQRFEVVVTGAKYAREFFQLALARIVDAQDAQRGDG
ncbi:MAG: hypothetical protein JWO05_1133 [Gemmatimonadetes bacterium]|nr:hypothetical protein [Gemmatimonadota bacterium]